MPHRAADRFCSVHAEVLAAIHEGIALFRAAGYRNDWIAQARRLRATKLAATLACRLTPERFELRLIVSRPPTPLYDHVILACDPDEVAFAHRFKDVVEADGKVVVTSRHSKPLLTLSLQEIEANQAPTLPRERSYLRDEAHLA